MGNTDKFDLIADRYDTPERIQIAKASADAIRRHLIDVKSRAAIDFGCGTGLVGMDLLNEFHSVLFLDASQNMIDRITQKISAFHLQNAAALCFDLEKEHPSGLRADYIFMAQVLLHIKDIESILSRLYEVLNESGHLFIIDFDKNESVTSALVHKGFDQTELADIMTKIGFRAIRSETFYTGSNLFMGQDASLFILDSQK